MIMSWYIIKDYVPIINLYITICLSKSTFEHPVLDKTKDVNPYNIDKRLFNILTFFMIEILILFIPL